jgi:hypothetical protein
MIIFKHRKIESEKSRGMKKMKKKTKIILLATLGICLFSFMPVVVGKANSRPISDYTATNYYVGGWLDPESNIIIYPHGFWVAFGYEVISDCIHSGSILERDLKDGRILYQVNLHVKGAWILVAYFQDRLIFVGEMNYTFTATVIVDGVFGGPIPNLMEIFFFGVGEVIRTHIVGSGTGVFVDDDAAVEQGFTPGATAKVKMNQVGISIPEDHPQYDPEYGLIMYPVEFFFFH